MCPDFFRHPLYSGCWDTILFIFPCGWSRGLWTPKTPISSTARGPLVLGLCSVSCSSHTGVCSWSHALSSAPPSATLKSRSMGVSSSPPACSHPWQTTTLGLSWGEKTADRRRLQLHLFTRSWFSKKKWWLLWECKLIQPWWRWYGDSFKKTRRKTTIRSSNPTTGHVVWENHNTKKQQPKTKNKHVPYCSMQHDLQ